MIGGFSGSMQAVRSIRRLPGAHHAPIKVAVPDIRSVVWETAVLSSKTGRNGDSSPSPKHGTS